MRAILTEMKNVRSILRAARDILRTRGIKGLFREYGWKFVLVIFTYYLIRDVTLYILIPMFIFKSLP